MKLIDSNKEEYGEVYLLDNGLIIVPKQDDIYYYQLSFKVSFPKDKADEFKQTLSKSEGIVLNEFEDYIYRNIKLYEDQLRKRLNKDIFKTLTQEKMKNMVTHKYGHYVMLKKDLCDYDGIPYHIELLKELGEWDDDARKYHELRFKRLKERLKEHNIL